MPRPPRRFVPGFPAHLTHRGNARQAIFRRAADFGVYKHYLKEATEHHGVALNAYVLMTNHVHLMLTPQSPGAISRAMHSASRQYARYFNARYQRTGTLWEGRFHSGIIRSERYVFACCRYIDLNPVRAGIVPRPELYDWSSHRFYAHGAPDDLVTPYPSILELSANPERRQAAYRALFEVAGDAKEYEAIRKATQSGGLIGAARKRPGRPRKEEATNLTQ